MPELGLSDLAAGKHVNFLWQTPIFPPWRWFFVFDARPYSSDIAALGLTEKTAIDEYSDVPQYEQFAISG